MYRLVGKLPFWAYVVGQIGKDFAAFVAITLFPMYMYRKCQNMNDIDHSCACANGIFIR